MEPLSGLPTVRVAAVQAMPVVLDLEASLEKALGLIDLLVALDQTPGFYDSYLLETGWGLLFTFLVAAPLAALVRDPFLTAPLVQVSVAAVAVALAAIVSGALLQLLPALALGLDAAVLAYLTRRTVRVQKGWRPHPAVAVAAVVLLPGSLAYAADMVVGFRQGRAPTDDITWGLDHWPMQAAFAIAAAANALVLAVAVGRRWSGTLLSAATLVVSTAWFGLANVAYPDHPAGVGGHWGAAVVAWAGCVGTVVIVVLVRRRAPNARARGPQRSSVS